MGIIPEFVFMEQSSWESRGVYYSQNEAELSSRDAKQIRDASKLSIGGIYEEKCPDKIEDGKVVIKGRTIRRFKILGQARSKEPKWISILIGEEENPIDVSLADLGVLPYQTVKRNSAKGEETHNIYRLNRYVVPVN